MPINRTQLQKLRKAHIKGLESVAVEMTNRSKRLAVKHNDNGTRANSVTHTATRSNVLWGIPLASAPHARYLELGFRPHWVPFEKIGLWMQRHRVGYVSVRSQRILKSGKRSTRRRTFLGGGLYVGGKNSRLQTGPGGTSGMIMRGRKRLRSSWFTRGGISKDLPSGKVGHPILSPVARQIRTFDKQAFLRGFRAGVR